MPFNGTKFSGVFEKKIFHFTVFWFKNAKINFFEEKCFLIDFIKFKCMRSETGISHLKITEHLKFYVRQLFYSVFLKLHFPRFF